MNLQLLPKPISNIQKKIAQQIYWKAFKLYLAIKLSYKQIYHKKIVQIMYNKYIGYSVNLDLSLLKGEKNSECLSYIDKCLKIVPVFKSLSLSFQHCYEWDVKNSEQFRNILQQMNIFRKENLQILSINLKLTILKCQTLNMMHIFYGLIQLKYLKSLSLNLSDNNLQDSEIMIMLEQVLEQLINLNFLYLDFDNNQLGLREQNIIQLGQSLKNLKKLRYLNLGLSKNNLGANEDNFKFLGVGFLELGNSLKHLSLNLDYNQFGGKDNNQVRKGRNIMLLGTELSKLDRLEVLEISLRLNQIQSYTLVGLFHGLKKHNKIKSLKIVLEGQNKKDIEKIKQQFCILNIQELSIE